MRGTQRTVQIRTRLQQLSHVKPERRVKKSLYLGHYDGEQVRFIIRSRSQELSRSQIAIKNLGWQRSPLYESDADDYSTSWVQPDHPNLLPFLGYSTTCFPNTLSFITQWCPLGNLRDYNASFPDQVWILVSRMSDEATEPCMLTAHFSYAKSQREWRICTVMK